MKKVWFKTGKSEARKTSLPYYIEQNQLPTKKTLKNTKDISSNQ